MKQFLCDKNWEFVEEPIEAGASLTLAKITFFEHGNRLIEKAIPRISFTS